MLKSSGHYTCRIPTQYAGSILNRLTLTEPTDIGVIYPVPEQPNAVPTERLMTLTTCDPKYGVRFQRLIVVGTLMEQP